MKADFKPTLISFIIYNIQYYIRANPLIFYQTNIKLQFMLGYFIF